MKKTFYKISIMTALIAGFSSCAIEEPVSVQADQTEKLSPVSEEALEGELLVRFDSRVSDILEKSGVTKSGPLAPASRSGVLSVDEILELVKGYQVERVFPIDTRSEEKARKEGLHLWYVVRFSDEYPVEKVAADLAQLGEVSRVEYNRTLKRAETGKAVPLTREAMKQMKASAKAAKFNDTHLGLQWHLVNNGDLGQTKFVAGADVNVEKAWDLCTGDPSVVVAILDEGFDITHPDLKGSLWTNENEVWRSVEDNDGNGYAGDYHGYNFAAGNGVISTGGRYDTGHGTHVAGVIAATNNNNIGISSIAGGNGTEPGVKIMSCQIFSGSIAATVLDEVRAIKYAADNGAVILQCSWGYISGAANPYDWSPQFSTSEQWKNSNVLEFKALDYFDEAYMGVLIDWRKDNSDDAQDNEIDVLVMSKSTPIFISCKMKKPVNYDVYEVAYLATRLGGDNARSIMATTYNIGREDPWGNGIYGRLNKMNVGLVEVDNLVKKDSKEVWEKVMQYIH